MHQILFFAHVLTRLAAEVSMFEIQFMSFDATIHFWKFQSDRSVSSWIWRWKCWSRNPICSIWLKMWKTKLLNVMITNPNSIMWENGFWDFRIQNFISRRTFPSSKPTLTQSDQTERPSLGDMRHSNYESSLIRTTSLMLTWQDIH